MTTNKKTYNRQYCQRREVKERIKKLRHNPAYRARRNEMERQRMQDPAFKRRKYQINGASLLRRMRGMTLEQRATLLKKQKGRCPICRCDITKLSHLDHCHKTGKNRGLLCRRCNMAIGMFGDCPRLLRRALSYLLHAR